MKKKKKKKKKKEMNANNVLNIHNKNSIRYKYIG